LWQKSTRQDKHVHQKGRHATREAMPDEIKLLICILAIGLPTLFVLLWLVITTAVVATSGWTRLQKRFPARDDVALLTVTRQNGKMGTASLRGALKLEACPLGLRVGMTRLIGPFHRSFEVPWNEITVEPGQPYHGVRVLLRFGKPEVGTLTVLETVWQQLSAHANG